MGEKRLMKNQSANLHQPIVNHAPLMLVNRFNNEASFTHGKYGRTQARVAPL